MSGQVQYRILLADDHGLIRHGMKNMIDKNHMMSVVGEAGDGEELLDLLDREAFDLLILDISMPKMGGIEAIGLVKNKYPWIKILMVTMHKTKQYFYNAMTAGADGYLVKDDPDEELLVAIGRIQEGRTYISPHFAEDFADDVNNIYRMDKRNPFQELTKREKEILQFVVDGYTSKKMADRLGLSHRTVDHHRSNLLKKFKMKNSVELVNYAVLNGFVTPNKY